MKRKDSIFTDVPIRRMKRNMFDLSHEVKMSGKFGTLMPMFLMDCLPGDSIKDVTTVFLRAAPLLAPIMHRVDVKTHFFFVPNRLLTNHWENKITGGQDGTLDPVLPYITPTQIQGEDESTALFSEGSLWDYLGLPVFSGVEPTTFSGIGVSALPFRAYAKIWNDYYRDPNFDAELDLDLDNQGEVSPEMVAGGLLNLRNHMWQRDYFTSALPWAQRGTEVLMPVTGQIDTVRNVSGAYAGTQKYLATDAVAADGNLGFADSANPLVNFTSAYLEFTGSSTTINDLRRSVAIQQWLESNARGGYRYIEQIEQHFDERVPDYRLQRAEYLGGGSQPITISEVLATADSTGVPVGDMAGHGVSIGKTNRFKYQCKEHGWILGILTVTPQTAYQQGISRMWSRTDKFDFAWPELANIGEQEILSKEVFFSFDNDDLVANEALFGYIPRYSEYKFLNDRVAGGFRSSLSYWHLGRIFTSRPSLDANFTTMAEDGNEDEDSFRRIFVVQDGTDYLWMQLFHRCTALRKLPYFGVPKLG